MSTSFHPSRYSIPINVPGKGHQLPAYGQCFSVSPPECDDVTLSSLSLVTGTTSYSHAGYSAISTSSASSSSSSGFQSLPQALHSSSGVVPAAADYDAAGSASGVDFQDMMHQRFSHAFNPVPLDRSMAVQAQTSGKLNAKHRELVDLQRQAQSRLARTRVRFQQGMRDARDVRSDLEWTSKKVSALNAKALRKYPKEYAKARARFPSPEC